MTAQNFLLMIGLIISTATLAYFIRQAIRRNRAHAFDAADREYRNQITDLLNDLAAVRQARQDEQQRFASNMQRYASEVYALRTASLTTRDLQTLLDILATLDMAHQTWLPIKGTEPWRARTAAQIKQLNVIATRIYDSINGTSPAAQIEQPAAGKAA